MHLVNFFGYVSRCNRPNDACILVKKYDALSWLFEQFPDVKLYGLYLFVPSVLWIGPHIFIPLVSFVWTSSSNYCNEIKRFPFDRNLLDFFLYSLLCLKYDINLDYLFLQNNLKISILYWVVCFCMSVFATIAWKTKIHVEVSDKMEKEDKFIDAIETTSITLSWIFFFIWNLLFH